ncbi:MAG: FMN-binding glutamate synthase family protein [Candidatus Pacebacteria bacterium]|nr:FMN-binding glutamate synthase family protein [Candidatus Paceibacterota bacterium]
MKYVFTQWWIYPVLFLIIVAMYDIFQKKHTIWRKFPIIGHFRNFFETIGPELRQYLFSGDQEEQPFNRNERRAIYSASKKQNENFGFGTTQDQNIAGHIIIKQSNFPVLNEKSYVFSKDDPTIIPCAKVLGEWRDREKKFRPQSVINISAMSYGSLGKKAIEALNKGAESVNCLHNTGEGGVSPHHLHGGDLIWQLGTGYFGARNTDGSLNIKKLVEKCNQHDAIKAIEIKLSQGAKPGKGGILPGKKVTQEIAEIRGIPVGETCLSPNAHSAFSNISEMIDIIEEIAEKTGLPVGIKSAVGKTEFWYELAVEMKRRNQGPDFISIDGGEGGTGAAPLSFSDHVSVPFRTGIREVYGIFQEVDLHRSVVWIGSGKLGFPEQAIYALAMGCDMVQIAREAMLSIGCIQAQKCHNGQCPVNIASHKGQWLVDAEHKAWRFSNYIRSFRKNLLALSNASGYEHPCQFTTQDILIAQGGDKFTTLCDHFDNFRTDVPEVFWN